MPATPSVVLLDAERHLLAASFHDPAWLAAAKRDLRADLFTEPRHQILWSAIVSSTLDGFPADEVSILADLQASRLTEQAGGHAYVNELSSLLYGPTPAVARWQAAITEAARARSLAAALDLAKSKATSGAFTPDEIADDLRRIAEQTTAPTRKPGDTGPSRFTFEDLLTFDRTQDPTAVLGNRWLCRGGSCLLVAQTGAGKSALTTQAAMTWALGRDFFGIKTRVGPLRSLVIQSENDLGDVAESVQGTLAGMGIASGSDLARDIGSRVAFYREAVRTGDDFGKLLRELVLAHKADLVFIDPLLGFAGIDIADQKESSHFLRHVLQPVLTETGVILFSIHHTTKPKPKAEQAGNTSSDLSYLGAGSAELANWHRAVMVLQRDQTPEGEPEQPLFTLRLAKRGGRAGLTDEQDAFTTAIPLRHSKEPGVIRWERRLAHLPAEQDTPPIEQKGTAKAFWGQGGGHTFGEYA
jgi:hypothetical protein